MLGKYVKDKGIDPLLSFIVL